MDVERDIKPVPDTTSSSPTTDVKHDVPLEIYIDPIKERKIMNKFDMLVMPQFVIIILLGYLDRSNIGNARIFGFEEDIGLTGNQFANLSSLFYVTYVIFEVPWVLAVKKWGANSVMAVAIVTWSAVTIGAGFVHNYGQIVACRLLLGMFEAGIFPALAFVISTVYPRESQAKRIAVLYGSIALSGAAWRWLFIIEGIISIVLGVACWATLPHTAEQAWFLTQDERQLMLDRRRRDAAYKGDDKLSWSDVKLAFTDPMVVIAGLALFCAGIPLFGFGIFLPTIIRGMGFATLQVNLLTIPCYVFGLIYLAFITWLSDKLRKRAMMAVIAPWIVIVGYAIAIGTGNRGAGYFAMFLCTGIYSFNTVLMAWVSNNIRPDSKRSAALPWFICIANVSGVAAAQVYPNFTAPRYIMGNAISLGMEFTAVLGIGVIYWMLKRRNAVKAKQRAEA
ncbi:putative transporter [Cyphellophora attinorum]|uniref:Putative transporter n=1 Tax=Cyphellophora attinorum TaxID=1664694 RepID=A0A0N1H822_9EURO|nr:putative transporter [Phialophora attinorum]KPI39076.1 putative transporter [Phialophora attinorum]